jgi:hypothetical protein
MYETHLHGKNLPVLFTKGYIYTFERRLGRAAFLAFFQGPAINIVPSKIERDNWLKRLYEYVYLESEDYQPLDYIYTSLFFQGLIDGYENDSQRIASISREIGKRWWFIKPPVEDVYNSDSLCNIFYDSIYKYIETLKQPPRNILTRKQIILDVFIYIISIFGEKSEIPYYVHKKQII